MIPFDPADYVRKNIPYKVEQHNVGRGHAYWVEGHMNPDAKIGLWPSVTTVLNAVVAKPGLVPWAREQAYKAVEEALNQEGILETGIAVRPQRAWAAQIIANARKLEDNAKRDYGADVHKLVETFYTGEEYQDVDRIISRLEQWRTTNKWQLAASELPVFYDGIAGTVDLLLYRSGTWVVADIKTGKVYPEAAMQVAAYQYAVERMLKLSGTEGIVLSIPQGEMLKEYKVDSTLGKAGYDAARLMRALLTDQVLLSG